MVCNLQILPLDYVVEPIFGDMYVRVLRMIFKFGQIQVRFFVCLFVFF